MLTTMLACRSDFSIGESILTPKKIVAAAKEAGQSSVALTDTMSITGMIEFTNAALKEEMKPIIGCRIRLVDDPTLRKVKGEKWKMPPVYMITVYVLSEQGMKFLLRTLSKAHSEENFYHHAQIGIEEFIKDLRDLRTEITNKDIVITTGDQHSLFHHPSHYGILKELIDAIGPENVHPALIPINTPYFDTLNEYALTLCDQLRLDPIVIRPVFYGREDDEANAHEVMTAVSHPVKAVKLSEIWHWSMECRDLHPMTSDELADEIKAAVSRLARLRGRALSFVAAMFKRGMAKSRELPDRVTYQWSKQKVSLPVMAADEFQAVKDSCRAGWSKRFGTSTFGHRPTRTELETIYKPRLAYELGVLKKLEFSGYFLLVEEIVNYAKSNGILVGPGRGSVGGSLVAYLMGITDCDPIRFGLLFERFINPDRIDLPDADLDFMSARRHEVVDYLVDKYGRDRVAGISNFGKMASASTIRNVGKAFGLEEEDYRCSKFVPKLHGQPVKLDEARRVAEIDAFAQENELIWSMCQRLEGTMNILGRHAAGIVVAGEDLVNRAVVERRSGEPIINWDKRIVEEQGLVKVDILGLETLDLIDLTTRYIREHRGKKVNLMQIALDDAKVLEQFANAQTVGIFQFESGGMRRLLRELGKDGTITFDDITAATALYRPGPMESGMMDSYWKRKQGLETVIYDHPDMEPILAPTFGVMVYQEQVMQVSREIAGYSAPDADKLRKIMGKKLPDEMKKERGKFVDGCVATIGCDEDWAGELFDKIEGFAGYGFNKSHSVEYTLISYQAMWLKTYFPVEFFAAALSLMKEDRLPALLKDADRKGVEIVLPDINLSTDRFEILNDRQLCVPFNRIKGVGSKTAEKIVELRKLGGKFADIDDLEKRRVGHGRSLHKGHVEKLNLIGAFASIEPTQKPARHPDRIKDQVELIPGLVAAYVPINRPIDRSKTAKIGIVELAADYQKAAEDDGEMAIMPNFGRSARFFAIYDAPTSGELQSGRFTDARSFGSVEEALAENDLRRADGYWTGLVKREKVGKQIVASEIAVGTPILKEELRLLKPPIIVLLGSQVVRHFLPDFKGKASDEAGKVVYSKEHDANIVVGFNPGEIYHDPDKQERMNAVFRSVSDLLS